MDEYIKRQNMVSAICERCNQDFSESPCEPSECFIRQTIKNIPSADVIPKSEVEATVEKLMRATDKVICEAKAEVARTFRKRMNEKMGKHTHLLGKEYVQRIMRKVEKELIGEEDA